MPRHKRPPIDREREATYFKLRNQLIGWAWHGCAQEAMPGLTSDPNAVERELYPQLFEGTDDEAYPSDEET
jgi:hypothetical protein